MRIGIMGGTFNPIHHGHLILSEYIRIKENLDKVIFIPTGNPPHKDIHDLLDGETRLEMVDLAIKNNPFFKSLDIEVKRETTSYTVDTLRSLKDKYPEHDLYMIIGADNLLSLRTWKEFHRIFSYANFIVADRLGLCHEDVYKEIDRLNQDYDANIIYLDSPVIEISSTLIRQRLKDNLSIKYLVCEDVEDYIERNNLYR